MSERVGLTTVTILSSVEGLEVARRLAEDLDAEPFFDSVLVWEKDVFALSQTALESLLGTAERTDFAVFILMDDDFASSRASQGGGGANVLFELGLFLGMLGRKRTFVVAPRQVLNQLPSDIVGLVVSDLSALGDKAALQHVSKQIRNEAVHLGSARESNQPRTQSCFISYGRTDRRFVEQLHEDLQEAGIRAWLDSRDLISGDTITGQIDQAVRSSDILLLVLSRDTLGSTWIAYEADRAFRSTLGDGPKCIPIALDDDAFERAPGVLQGIKFADFRDWKDSASYRQEFKRLMSAVTTLAATKEG